jgi:outer membrane receptor protein involved in Fe transport
MKNSFTPIKAALFIWTALAIHATGQDNTKPDTATKPKTPATQPDTGTTVLPEVDVIEQLNQVRDEIVPSLGATQYNIGQLRLDSQAQGVNAPFNETVLRLPGVAQDSYGQLHIRGEHANLQYRINDVLLPEGISGFSQELDTRFVRDMSLITGALPAQFGYRTAGIVDIHTKSGEAANGGEISIYGGSYDTLRESFEYGTTVGKLTYYIMGSTMHSDLGIENPTSSARPLHDYTDQYKGFAYFSYLIDQSSRLNLILSGGQSNFQIPNNPNQTPAFTVGNTSVFSSSTLNEHQTEKNYYGILAYQKSVGDLNFQLSAFSRFSSTHYTPDQVGDLIFNGVASNVDRSIVSNGFQADGSYKINDRHTLRGGMSFTEEAAKVTTANTVFSTDDMGNQLSTTPFTINDNSNKMGYLYGVYLQDEWKPFDKLTINYGGRFDVVNAYTNENQLSPRLNFVYNPTKTTTLHAGYARYFTPPPLELVSQTSVNKFTNTTNASEVTQSSTVKSERSHYFDVGITQKVTPDFQMGVDTYYKIAKNQLDEGQFGQALIFSPFNYATGRIYGAEFTANYEKNGFATYLNLAYSVATGKDITSGQFQFSQAELDYISTHSVYLDHDQRLTGSFGMSYSWNGTKVSADAIYGSGLRKGFANTEKGQAYCTVNLGIEHAFKLSGRRQFKVRFDVVNLFDQIYELRDGSGIGVAAPQYGARRGLYLGLAYDF